MAPILRGEVNQKYLKFGCGRQICSLTRQEQAFVTEELERGKIGMIIFCSNLLLPAPLFSKSFTGDIGAQKCLR